MSKPKIAVYKLSSCAGCQLEFLNLEDNLLDIVGLLDIKYFVMAKRDKGEGPFDIGFVEGAVTCGDEIERLKKAREECKVLVALGSCACYGGVPSIKNDTSQYEIEQRVYKNLSAIHSTKALGIEQYVKVDAYLKGCPVSKIELVDFVKAALLGRKPYLRAHSVCMECKLDENVCLSVTKGIPCMGPVTSAGCGALCPSVSRGCEGCRGPANDSNTESLARSLKEYGLSKQDVARKFKKYAGETPQFKKGAEAL